MDIALSPMDRKLIRLLEEDSRRSYTELAAMLGVSRMTVKNRVDRLVDRGVIETFTIKLADAGSQGPFQPAATAFFHLKLKRPFCKTVFETIESWPEVLGAWSIAGETDMTLLVSCASDGTLEELRDRLARHHEVQALSTAMVLRQWRHKTEGAPGAAQHLPDQGALEKQDPRVQEGTL